MAILAEEMGSILTKPRLGAWLRSTGWRALRGKVLRGRIHFSPRRLEESGEYLDLEASAGIETQLGLRFYTRWYTLFPQVMKNTNTMHWLTILSYQVDMLFHCLTRHLKKYNKPK